MEAGGSMIHAITQILASKFSWVDPSAAVAESSGFFVDAEVAFSKRFTRYLVCFHILARISSLGVS